MRPEIDELRPMTAGRLLEIWQEQRAAGGSGLERSLLCNAGVLAECCYRQGEPVFTDSAQVLRTLTAREMEALLIRLTDGEETPPEHLNPAFDPERFAAMKGE